MTAGNWPGFTSEVIWESQAPGWASGSFTSGEDQPTHTGSGRSRTPVYKTQALFPDSYRGKLQKVALVLGILKGRLCLGGRQRPAGERHWELPALPPSSGRRTELLVGSRETAAGWSLSEDVDLPCWEHGRGHSPGEAGEGAARVWGLEQEEAQRCILSSITWQNPGLSAN